MDRTEPQTPHLSVSLTMTAEQYAELQREQGALDLARAYSIVGTPEERAFLAGEANSELRSVKAKIERIKKLKAGFVEPAKQIQRNAEALFDPALEALAASERFLKGQLTDYDTDCKRIADEARRAREAEERAARQKAEQDAAAERARAAEQAAAAQRAARKAEEDRLAALAAGNKRAAAAAAAEQAKQEEKARAAIENGDSKAMEIELSASAAPVTTIVPEPMKIEGFSTRENWVAELAAGKSEEDATYDIAVAVAGGRRDLLPLLKRDAPASNRLAKAQRKNMNVPGLVSVNRPIAASRAA